MNVKQKKLKELHKLARHYALHDQRRALARMIKDKAAPGIGNKKAVLRAIIRQVNSDRTSPAWLMPYAGIDRLSFRISGCQYQLEACILCIYAFRAKLARLPVKHFK